MPTSFAMRLSGPGYRFLTRMKPKGSANKSDYNPSGLLGRNQAFSLQIANTKEQVEGTPAKDRLLPPKYRKSQTGSGQNGLTY
jgi:hypothetical protein